MLLLNYKKKTVVLGIFRSNLLFIEFFFFDKFFNFFLLFEAKQYQIGEILRKQINGYMATNK